MTDECGVANRQGEEACRVACPAQLVDVYDQKERSAGCDPRGMREAYDAFRELVEHFPASRYAEDSRNRMAHLVNFLAKGEINVARFYYARGAYVATVNRTKYVIERYQRTPSIEDALGLQAMAYKKMGMEGLMADTVRVLEKNFPGSHYLKELNT